ncbi:hypothetical protein K388_01927 [Streptomyces sp. KhCrAH-43]|uniref:hypothetical protein n=1 Tax=unclassified Streptomyces TaxID=2593676 RepID=UPI00035E8BF1|nr:MULTISPECIES: hypothetical protein [unclassified Streptomyces]MYS34928.1 hypothetical protein [Streptomyces sp. SID4920]MYX65295.1 hypothetical protein [Streptomyces sp. SID8373]RAJ64732.1 hypothetical protein K388_01927 [Streptomyces sp. KhCrAH-43]
MAETIHVRGEGGAIFAMDLPLPEGIADRYERGLLVRVNADGSPYAGPPASAPPAPPRAPDTPPADPVDEPGPVDTAGRPAVNAAKSEWIAYVVSRGLLSAEDAANYTKADLIDMAS